MKRLFRIGFGTLLYSIIPILSWIVLGLIMHDERIENVFSITYAIQWVFMVIVSLFATGANIRKEKEKDENAVWNSIFWGTIFAIVIFSIPLVFVDEYISFFGQNVQFYRPYVLYGIGLIFIQTLFSLVLEKLYFEDRNKLANIHLISFNLTTFCVLVLSALIFKNVIAAFITTLSVLLIYIIVLYIIEFKKFKIKFDFFKNFKYESANIFSYLFMLVIYLFGLKNAFSAGEEYVLALSIAGLCTDPFWDGLNAISIVAKVDIAKGRYNYKKEIKNAYFFAGVVTLCSSVMTISLSLLNHANLSIVLIYLAFNLFDMALHPFKSIIYAFTQIEYSPTLNTIFDVSFKVIRAILSIFILSPYCNEIGQVAQAILFFITFITLRFVKYKVVDGKILVKQKKLKRLEENREEANKNLDNC